MSTLLAAVLTYATLRRMVKTQSYVHLADREKGADKEDMSKPAAQ